MRPTSAPHDKTTRTRARPVRVCFPFVGDSVGGAHMSALLLIEGLDRDRYEPLIVVHEPGPLADHLKSRNIPFTPLPLPSYAGRTPGLASIATAMARNAPRLVRFLDDEGIGIVHGNDFRMNLTWPIPVRLSGRRFVWHQRSLPYSKSVLWRLAGLFSNHVVCISRTVLQGLPPFRNGRASVIINPFATATGTGGNPSRDAARRALIAELKLDPAVRIVGLVGRINHQKRPRTFIEAATKIAAHIDGPCAFVLIGEGAAGEIDLLRRRADELSIRKSVHFLGFRHPVEPYLAGMDVLMATAKGDGFGRSLVESMSVGTPVVAVRSGGHVEIVDDGRTGLLAPLDAPDALANAACRILMDTGFGACLADRARAEVTQRFSVATHVSEMQAVYDRLTGAP